MGSSQCNCLRMFKKHSTAFTKIQDIAQIMKIHIVVALVAVALQLSAEEEYISPVTGKPVPADGKFTVEQIKARDERVMQKTGGFLLQKASGPQLLLVDARDRPSGAVDEVARLYKLGAHLDANVEKTPRGAKVAYDFAKEISDAKKPLMTLVVFDGNPTFPALAVYPEERIGLVNADRLKGGEDPAAPEVRVAKEVWRAMGFIGGVGFSQYENDMMQPYYTLKELDGNIHAYIQPMNMAKMGKFWKRFGVKKEARVPYLVAVQEGWAPAPTNDVQKAIWDKVHAVPKTPLKIEFDPKKGR